MGNGKQLLSNAEVNTPLDRPGTRVNTGNSLSERATNDTANPVLRRGVGDAARGGCQACHQALQDRRMGWHFV